MVTAGLAAFPLHRHRRYAWIVRQALDLVLLLAPVHHVRLADISRCQVNPNVLIAQLVNFPLNPARPCASFAKLEDSRAHHQLHHLAFSVLQVATAATQQPLMKAHAFRVQLASIVP